MRVLVGWRGKLYRFLSVESAARDGSLSVAIHEKRQTHHITLHQSGQINFKGTRQTVYIEPLIAMTKPFGFYRYRVPKVSALNEFTKKPDADDAVLELKEAGDAISFVFVISPKGGLPEFPGSVSVTYVESYTLTVAVEPKRWVVDARREKDFVRMWPTKGHFTLQQMSEEGAIVKFHQVKLKTHGAVLYEPNGAGEWMLVFTVPMRVAPSVKIEMTDPSLHVTDQDVTRDARSERVMVRFKVRRKKTAEIIKTPAKIRSIELDSEL